MDHPFAAPSPADETPALRDHDYPVTWGDRLLEAIKRAVPNEEARHHLLTTYARALAAALPRYHIPPPLEKTLRFHDRSLPILDPIAAKQVDQLRANCREFGVPLHDIGSDTQGIVHVIGPELGLTQPGMTVVCGDSHTSTHGAFGALAFGIGTTEVEHVLATQCLLQNKPKTAVVRFDGAIPTGVTGKDLILALIAKIGVGGGTSHVLEYTGSAIRSLSMEARMTVCNMSIEGGARAGMVAPDDTTFEYLASRPRAPKGADWDAAVARWRQLPSDEGAAYDKTITRNYFPCKNPYFITRLEATRQNYDFLVAIHLSCGDLFFQSPK